MPTQTITKLQLAKLLTGTIWTLVKYASWTSYKPLPADAERRFKVVYWAAWHWLDLIRLFDDQKLVQKEIYNSLDPESPFAIKISDGKTPGPDGTILPFGVPFPGQQGGEWSPSPRVDGHSTRAAQLAKFNLDYRMKDFPE